MATRWDRSISNRISFYYSGMVGDGSNQSRVNLSISDWFGFNFSILFNKGQTQMLATEVVNQNVDINLIDSFRTVYNVVSNIYAKNEANVIYLEIIWIFLIKIAFYFSFLLQESSYSWIAEEKSKFNCVLQEWSAREVTL